MVSAVRCPNPKCQKYMLVEPADRGKVVPCLICKQPIKVPAADPVPVAKPRPPKEPDLIGDLNLG
ncbi:MAG TPA: hypothetical protein VGJ05_00235 [Fimbriiglobus sp.]